jgi:predicted ATPase
MNLKQIVVKNYRQLSEQTFEPGDWTVIVGPNGCGKSTLARAIEYAFRGSHATEIVHVNGEQSLRKDIIRGGMPSVEFTVNLNQQDFVLAGRHAQPGRQVSFPSLEISFTRIAGIPQGQSQLSDISFGVTKASSKGGTVNLDEGPKKQFSSYISDEKVLLIPAERFLGNGHTNQPPRIPNGSTLMRDLRMHDSHRDSGDETKVERVQSCLMRIFPGVRKVKPVERSSNPGIDYDRIPSYWMGSGHREATVIVGEIAISDAPIVIIEEPERSFHPGLIRKLLDEIRSEFSERQFIILTHSPIVMGATRAGEIWEFRTNGTIKRVADEEIGAAAARLGVGVSDVLDYELLLLVEGVTDANAWNEWFKLDKLERCCRAIDIDGFGNAQYYANANVINARVTKPVVCMTFDGDILKKKNGNDNIRIAKTLCEANEGSSFQTSEPTLEAYLLNPDAIERVYQKDAGTLRVWIDELTSEKKAKLAEARKRNPNKEDISPVKEVFQDVLAKIDEKIDYKEASRLVAAQLKRQELPKDVSGKDILTQLSALLENRRKKLSQ